MSPFILTAALAASPSLDNTWRGYARRFIQRDGRVIDHRDQAVSTSEGQAYALIRAVWIDDPKTFGRVLRWTRDNLQSGDPGALPAWRWGAREDGSWGVLDAQPAADADQWMAYALLLAAERWSEPTYADQARALLAAIWSAEVLQHPTAGWVMLPGPWAADAETLRVNPSYFLPFAWRRFAAADPERPWGALLDNSYTILNALMDGGRLPPDWAEWDAEAGRWEAVGPFGYEAFRLAWTLAAEARWYGEARALVLLGEMQSLQQRWQADGKLPAELDVETLDGIGEEYPGLYGALLPAWGVTASHDAATLFQVELAPRKTTRGWADEDDYYGNNWTWMGVALWQGLALPELRG